MVFDTKFRRYSNAECVFTQGCHVSVGSIVAISTCAGSNEEVR